MIQKVTCYLKSCHKIMALLYILTLTTFYLGHSELSDYFKYYEIAHISIKTVDRPRRKIPNSRPSGEGDPIKLNFIGGNIFSNKLDSNSNFFQDDTRNNIHSKPIKLKVKAFNVTLKIRMRPSYTILSPDSTITIFEGDGKKTSRLEPSLHAHIYSGKIRGDPHSMVVGRIYGFEVSAVLLYRGTVYHVEPLQNFDGAGIGAEPVRGERPTVAVIYKDTDVKLPNVFPFASLYQKPLNGKLVPINRLGPMSPTSNRSRDVGSSPSSIDTTSSDTPSAGKRRNDIIQTLKSLNRAPLKSSLAEPNSKTCNVHLVADHRYVACARDKGKDPTDEMLFHVLAADSIYRTVDFDGDGIADNIGFVVDNVTLYTDPKGKVDGSGAYKLVDSLNNANDYLNAFSEYDWSGYCLALGFTCRTLEDGILGLTWIADADTNGRAGGICQIRGFLEEDGREYSFNTGIFTVMHKNKVVPQHISLITVTHELGHALGSYHDNVTECMGGDGGSGGVGGGGIQSRLSDTFLMYSEASTGGRRNNWLFSKCSKRQISAVLKVKGTCLSGPVCGNGVTDFGEECDCGSAAFCEEWDPCCNPPEYANDLPLNVEFSHPSHEGEYWMSMMEADGSDKVMDGVVKVLKVPPIYHLRNFSDVREELLRKNGDGYNSFRFLTHKPATNVGLKPGGHVKGKACTLRRDKGYTCSPLNDECCNEFCVRVDVAKNKNETSDCSSEFSSKLKGDKIGSFLFLENMSPTKLPSKLLISFLAIPIMSLRPCLLFC